MNYAEAIQFLYGLQMFGANFGLERTHKLAALVGNPQEKIRFIHVAGTNGKGSTCAMLESIYRAAGLRVGLFTSPHLVSFRERIQINRQLIPEGEVIWILSEIQPLLKQFSADNHPTMFEVVTVLALKYFAEQKCDLVIWETGLGGRLDATNIVTPLASVITNVALDHTQWLGDTLEKIAAEKAGIIKPGVPVLTAEDKLEVLQVIEAAALEKGAILTKVGQASRLPGERVSASGSTPAPTSSARAGETPALLLAGEHQKQNAALALATVETLQKQISVSAEKIREGLATVNWPGRLQLITRPSGQNILLDGAHNVAGAETLRTALRSGAPSTSSASCISNSSLPPPDKLKLELQREHAEPVLGAPAALILGVLADKDWQGMCKILAPLAQNIFTVSVATSRTASAEEVAAFFRSANPSAKVVACKNFSAALDACQDEPFVVVAGSLYLIGEALEKLGVLPSDGGERGLNEWSGKR